ncbi:ComEC family competence protein, partial [bacterium NHP-B]
MHTRWSGLSSLFTPFLTHEQDRLILWTPVLLGLGIAAYFSLTFEPPFWWALGAALCAGGCVGAVVLTYHRSLFLLHIVLLGLACVCLGFSAALWRTQALNTPMLNTHVKRATLEGVIENVTYLRYKGGPQAIKGARVIVRVTRIVPTLALHKVRLWIPCGWKTLRAGQHIRVKANLTKLPPPTWPYGYDMRRTCYFQGIGAKGFCLTPPSLRHAPPPLWRTMWMEPWRERLTHVLFEVLPMPHASVAAALLTGHTAGLPSSVRADFADAGMAHLLAISGLHMSIVAGLVFFMVYTLLGLWQRAVLFWPLHKIAAVATVLGTFLYLHLSGVHIPATRAFFMTTMAMTALLLDRSPLSLRLVAFAATFILIFRPENLLSPSFQLSFAAVTSLVAVFERVKAPTRFQQRWFHTGLSWLGISLLSTLIAGLATLPFTAATFHQATLLGMVANLVAIPLTTFVVMPLGMTLMLCSLMGVASWVAPFFALALSGLIAIAQTVAAWPLASVTVPAGAPWALGLITLSGLWMLLWQTPLRWLGAPLLLGGFWALWTP